MATIEHEPSVGLGHPAWHFVGMMQGVFELVSKGAGAVDVVNLFSRPGGSGSLLRIGVVMRVHVQFQPLVEALAMCGDEPDRLV